MAQHFVTVDSVTKKFPDPVLEQLAVDLPPGGGVSSWDDLEDMPPVIAAGDTAAEARTVIGAGTSDLAVATNAETVLGEDEAKAATPSGVAAAIAAIAASTPSLVQVYYDGEDWIDEDDNTITSRPTAKRVLALGGGEQPSWLIAGDAWYEAATVAPDPPDTTVLSENFEGGTNGGAITTGNSTASNVVAGTPTFINAAVEGILAGRYNAAAAGVATRHDHDPIDGTSWASMYFYVPALPSESVYFTSWYSPGSDKIGDIRLQADGSVVARNNNTAVITSTAVVTAASWHRIAWRITRNSQMEIRLYLGSNRHGTTPDWSGTGASTQNFTTGRLFLGTASAATLDVRFDRVRVAHTYEPAPMEA